MAEKYKKVHPTTIMLFKIGSFYHVYGKDSYIISAMFNYIIKPVANNITCGFGANAINKVKTRLENSKINYMLIDPRNNYDVDEEYDYGNLNMYEIELEKCYTMVRNRNDIKKITERLEMYIGKECFKKIIRKMEDILDESGKI